MKTSDVKESLKQVRALVEQLQQGVQRIEAIIELPSVEAADETWDSFQCFVEFARLKDNASAIAKEITSHIGALEEAASEKGEAYTVEGLTNEISNMINKPGSRRKRTYVPPFDIEKTLRAFVELRRKAHGEIEIIEEKEL